MNRGGAWFLGKLATPKGIALAAMPVMWAVAWCVAKAHGQEIVTDPQVRDGLMLGLLAAIVFFVKAPDAQHAARTAVHGSARWATRGDLRGLLGTQARAPAGSFVVGQAFRRDVVLPPDLVTQHVLIVGPSGTGKSRTLLMPNVAWARGSFVATDPKGELWRHTSGFHARAWRFAPRDPDASRSCNWIPLCTDPALADKLARAVVQPMPGSRGDDFWQLAEQQLVSALFQYAATLPGAPTPATVYQLLALRPSELMTRLREGGAPAACRIVGGHYEDAGQTASSVMKGVLNRLGWLSDPAVQRFTSAETAPPDFAALVKEPIAVYWVLHEQDTALLRPLSSLFFTLLLDQLQRLPEGEGTQGGVPVTLYLDEFANLGALPDFPTTISVARGRGLGLVLGVQSLAQLEGLYGRAGAATIRVNCATKLFLHGLDADGASYVSRLLGEQTIVGSRTSRSQGGVTTSDDVQGRSLLTADEVRRLDRDRLVMLVGNRRPAQVTKRWWGAALRPAPTEALGPARIWTAP